MLDLFKKNFDIIATTVIGAILIVAQQAGYSSGIVFIIALVLLIVAVVVRSRLETETTLNTKQILIGLILSVIIWVAVYVGVSEGTRVMVEEFEEEKDKLAIEITAQVNLLSTAQARIALLNVQKGVSLRPNPGNLVESKGDIPLCSTVEYLDEVTIDEVLWVNVYSPDLQAEGWVKSGSVSKSLGVCPTPTGTSTITPTASITPTPSKTPTSTPTPNPEEIVFAAIYKFYENINKEMLDEAWDTLHSDYQSIHDRLNWEESVLKRTYRVDISLYAIDVDANTAIADGYLFITPDFQGEQRIRTIICLTRQNYQTQWLIIDSFDSDTEKACKFK